MFAVGFINCFCPLQLKLSEAESHVIQLQRDTKSMREVIRDLQRARAEATAAAVAASQDNPQQSEGDAAIDTHKRELPSALTGSGKSTQRFKLFGDAHPVCSRPERHHTIHGGYAEATLAV